MAIIKTPRKKNAIIKPGKSVIPVKKEKNIYDLIIKYCLYALAFLLPIFFLPVTSDQLELPKVILFYCLVLIAAISWTAKMVIKKDLDFTHSFLDIPVIIFGIIYFAGFIFSVDKYNSLVGIPGYFSESLITTLFLILFYFIVVNNVRNLKEILTLITLPLISLSIAVVFNFFQIFGLYLLPWSLAKNVNFDLVSGSSTLLAIILSSMLPLFFCLLIISKQIISKWLLATLIVLAAALLFFIDSGVALVSLIIGLFVLIIFFSVRAKNLQPKWTILPTLILALSVIVIFIPMNKWTGINLSNEVNLPMGTSVQIVKSAISNYPLLGVGPENFYFAFGKYKPMEFNQTDLWNANFIRPFNFWLGLAAGSGVIGALVLLLICAWYFIFFVKNLIKKSIDKSYDQAWYLGLGIFIAWLILFAASWIYYMSFAAMFLFWLFLALGGALFAMGEERSAGREQKSKATNALAFSYSLFFSLLIITSICFAYFVCRYLAADIYFARAMGSLSQPLNNTEEKAKFNEATAKLDLANGLISQAIKFNPYEQDYYFMLAKVILAKVQLLSSDPKESQQISSLIAEFKNKMDAGLSVNKNSYQAYSAAINLYGDLRNIIGPSQVDPLILDIYNQAISLDANNPQYYLGRGQIYWDENQMVLNSLAGSNDEKEKAALKTESDRLVGLADDDFSHVTNLKSDLIWGHYGLALVKEAKGDRAGAIAELLQALNISPSDYNTLYNLGRIYLENNDLDKAIGALAQTIKLYPKDSNSHWQLSAAYDKKGNIDQAIAEMKIVVDLNPGNATAADKLKELEKKVKK